MDTVTFQSFRDRDFESLLERMCTVASLHVKNGATILSLPVAYDPQAYFSDNASSKQGPCFVGAIIYQNKE